MSIIGQLLGKVIGGDAGKSVVEYFDTKQKLKQQLKLTRLEGKIEVEKSKIEYRKKDLEYDNNWELAQLANSGWKDEFVLILLSSPVIMSFIPGLAPYALAGFDALEKTPDWFRWLILLIFAAIYGIRIYRRQDSPKLIERMMDLPGDKTEDVK